MIIMDITARRSAIAMSSFFLFNKICIFNLFFFCFGHINIHFMVTVLFSRAILDIYYFFKQTIAIHLHYSFEYSSIRLLQMFSHICLLGNSIDIFICEEEDAYIENKVCKEIQNKLSGLFRMLT